MKNKIITCIIIVYSLYLVEFCFLFILDCLRFSIEYPNGNVRDKIGVISKNVFIWTIVFRTLFGYSLLLLFLIIRVFNSTLRVVPRLSLVSFVSYMCLSLFYAYTIFPFTKDYLIFDLTYGGTYFYYSLVIILMAPFFLEKIGFFTMLNFENKDYKDDILDT